MLSDNDDHMHRPLTDNASSGGLWAGTRHLLCMFHLVFKNFGEHVKLPPFYRNKSKKKKATKIIELAKQWICSWFRDCETHDEITVSKLHLHAWLNTPHIIDIIQEQTSKAIMNVVDTIIWADYAKWARPYKLYIRSFDECTSNAVEHENWSMKEGGDVVHASMDIDTSASVMNSKTFHRNKMKKKKFAKSLNLTPLWSKTDTSQSIVTYAESLLREEWISRTFYDSSRVCADEWYLLSTRKLSPFSLNSPITRFRRVRIVKLVVFDEKGYLICSCGYHQRHGIPCRHILHITNVVQLEHFDPRWHKVFHHYYGRESDVTQVFNEARNNPVPGCLYEGDLLPNPDSLPLLNGTTCLSSYTTIINSPVPVVSNPSPFLDLRDVTPELINEGRGSTDTLSLTHRFNPVGLGSTVCVTNLTLSLHTDAEGLQSPAVSQSQDPDSVGTSDLVDASESSLPSSNASHAASGATDQVLESTSASAHVDCPLATVDDSDPDEELEDIRQVYFEIAELVESNPSLRKRALSHMKSLHESLVAEYNENPLARSESNIRNNKKAKIVSYNPPAESKHVRKRKKGVTG